jgi:hypothetical protein
LASAPGIEVGAPPRVGETLYTPEMVQPGANRPVTVDLRSVTARLGYEAAITPRHTGAGCIHGVHVEYGDGLQRGRADGGVNVAVVAANNRRPNFGPTVRGNRARSAWLFRSWIFMAAAGCNPRAA